MKSADLASRNLLPLIKLKSQFKPFLRQMEFFIDERLEKKYIDGFLFPCPPFYFSISSKTMIDRDLNSFASLTFRFGLVLPPYFICFR